LPLTVDPNDMKPKSQKNFKILNGRRVLLWISFLEHLRILQKKMLSIDMQVVTVTDRQNFESQLENQFDCIIVDYNNVNIATTLLGSSQKCLLLVLTSAMKWDSSRKKDGNIVPLFKPIQQSKLLNYLAHQYAPNDYPLINESLPPYLSLKEQLRPIDTYTKKRKGDTINEPPAQIEEVNTKKQKSAPTVIVELIPKLANSKPKVLIVEDNLTNNKLLVQIVKSDYEFASAFNGQEAVNMIDADTPYDIVLMDIQMPIMDGLEATREIRKKGFVVPIIAVTASVDQQNFDKCHVAGMDDFLAKPITKVRVLSMLKKWMKV